SIFTLQNAMALLGVTAKGLQFSVTAPVKAIRGLDNAIRNIPKNVQKMVKNFTKAVKTVQKFAKQITKLVKSFKKLADSIGKTLFSPLQNLIKRFTKFIHSIERIALYRAIRRGIQLITQGFQEGIENLYQYSLLINSDFHKSMDLLATDALYVKNSLGAMVSPLINAFAPAIDAITDKFVDLLNLVNQTFAALTGKETFTAAKKYATVWAEAAEETKKATTDAGDAVKDTLEEIKRYTLGFDELNVLGDPNKDNTANKNKNSLKDSDADEDVKDYLSMFQELPVSGAIADFVKKIREAIQNSEFYEAGKMIAEKLNEHFSSIEYETLGEKIGEKINNAITIAKGFLDFADFITLGEGVAKFLNKAFEQIDFLNLGAVLAGKIRLGLQFAFGFVKTFHFREFGEDLGKMISGFVISIDFDMAVKTLQMGFEGILDTIYGFLTQLQSFAFGVKIKNALSLAEFEGISERFQMIGEELKRNVSDFLKGLGAEIAIENPFDRLGAWLGTQLTIAFRKVPYAEIGATFGEGIQSIIANARNFWQNLDLSGLGSGIAKFLNNAIGNIDFWSVGAIIGEKLSTVVNGITSFLNTVNWDSVFDEITATITGFFENLDFNKVNFNHIGQSFGKFVNTALKNIAKFLKGLNTRGIADSISSFLESVFSEIDIDNFTDVFSWLVVDILDFVAELLENIDGKKVGKAIGKFLTGLDWGGIFYELGRVLLGTLRGLWDVLSTAVGEIWEKVNEKLDSVHIENPFSDEGAIGKAVSGWFTGIGDKFSEALQGIENKFSGFFGKIFSTEDGKTPADRFGEIMQGIEDKASAGAEKVGEALSGIWEFFGWTDIKASAHGESIGNSFIGIGKDSSDTSSVLQENWGLWQESFNETMDKIVNFAGNAKDKLKEHWGMWQQSFNETIDNMLQYVEKLKTGFKVAGNFIKNTVKNALNGCIGFVEGFVNAWVTGFNDIADIINGFSIDIPDWVPSIGGSSWSPNLPKYNTVSLPRFENGGFPKSGELFLANENGVPEMVGRMGGQTAVANNEQIVQGIAQGVMMAMNSGSQNQLIRQAITLLQAIAEKDPVVEVTTNSIDKAKNRQNLRNGVLS
ncbi:MAG TPA: hypothetical protein DCO72_10615, partial [Ruminococcus sp.]|nr:hypothetical protein [Ruminococcus sp.]